MMERSRRFNFRIKEVLEIEKGKDELNIIISIGIVG